MKIEHTSLERVSGFWDAIDEVARERKYLLLTEAPPIDRTQLFLEEIIEKRWTQLFAIDSNRLVGWCDIIPYPYEGVRHVGKMGMGVVPSHRGQGIGKRLLSTAIEDARSKGIERIEMEVFSTNTAAIVLYKKLGFTVEGRKLNARRLDGLEHDIVMMAL